MWSNGVRGGIVNNNRPIPA